MANRNERTNQAQRNEGNVREKGRENDGENEGENKAQQKVSACPAPAPKLPAPLQP